MKKENDEIMASILREEIEKLQNQQQEIISLFDKKNLEIESLVADYNSKIAKLQKEGQLNADKLNDEREQLRGSYLMLKKLIDEKQGQLNNCLNTSTNEPINSKVLTEEPKENSDVKSKKTKTSKSDSKSKLTPEQVDAIKQISNESEALNPTITRHQNQIKKSDIPEYLQDEYNKLN